MAHGTPDWGVTAGAVTTYQLTDLGELAVRLGSPISHDRRGDVVWWDDFEWSLNKWAATLNGTGAAAVISSGRARNGRSSCLLTAGSDGVRRVEITHENPMTVFSTLGFECSFNLPDAIESIELRIGVFSGAQFWDFRVRWLDVTDELQTYGPDVGYSTFASGVFLVTSDTLFHTAKLVVDPNLTRYVRLVLNSITYDLTGQSMSAAADTTDPELFVRMTLTGNAGFNRTAYVDDVILTQNEPV